LEKKKSPPNDPQGKKRGQENLKREGKEREVKKKQGECEKNPQKEVAHGRRGGEKPKTRIWAR